MSALSGYVTKELGGKRLSGKGTLIVNSLNGISSSILADSIKTGTK